MEQTNGSEMQTAIRQLAEKARSANGHPNPRDIAEAHELFEKRGNSLVDMFPGSTNLKVCKEPDWTTWLAIAEFFDAYHAALVEVDNKLATPLAKTSSQGI